MEGRDRGQDRKSSCLTTISLHTISRNNTKRFGDDLPIWSIEDIGRDLKTQPW
jgi:hypothetical protein